MVNKVAVVTGANRGLGFGIVKLLCTRGVEVVYLTSRNIEKGQEAVERLNKVGLKPQFYQLDTSDAKSVKVLAKHIKEKHGGLDILINNAGVSGDYRDWSYENSNYVIDINYRNNLIIQEFMFPVLKDNARVININSDFGLISKLRNTRWIESLSQENVTIEDINRFVAWFLDAAKNKNLNSNDFNTRLLLPYAISHIALNALTRIQQKLAGRGISVNAVHPGYMKTDMTWYKGDVTVDEASQIPVHLALDVEQSEKGKFMWCDKSFKDWTDVNFVVDSEYLDCIIPDASTKQE